MSSSAPPSITTWSCAASSLPHAPAFSPRPGRYLICLGFRPAKVQATNTPVTIRPAGGTAKLTVNQRAETTPFNFVPVGGFQFRAGDSGFVEITNGEADGRVAIDGVRWVWLNDLSPAPAAN